MSPLRLNGSTSGYSQIDAPAAAGDQTFTLPTTGGTLDRINRAGNILQVVSTQTGAVATGTTAIPVDDTIPQSTEGNEYMSLSITPTSSASKLLIQAEFNGAHSNAVSTIIVALFQDSTANALACSWTAPGTAGYPESILVNHYMTAGTTSSTTFKLRAGGSSAGTLTFNGAGGVRYLGGVLASFITITEIAA